MVSDSSYQYEYNLTDHLGNVRAVLDSNGDVVQRQGYYPFGGTFQQWTYTNPENLYQYNNKELQSETQWLDYGARMYDANLGRFFTKDRFAEKYIESTPYHYTLNNPIRYIDVNGDSLALFKNGTYVGTYDDGNKELSGYNQEVTTDEDGNETFTGGQAFGFNDPEIDAQAIRNGAISHVEFVSDEKVNKQLSRSGVLDNNGGHFYAYEHSTGGGRMDFGMKGHTFGDLEKNTFYISEGTAYNIGDFGNYLWGRAMRELGIPLPDARMGAHIHNIFFGRRYEYNEVYDFGPGTNGSPGFLDTEADQRAIINGYKTGGR